jgi:hypothetical protein
MTLPENHGSEEEEVQAKRICNILNLKKNRKFPKPQERFAHSGTRRLQDTKKLDQNRTSP